jgi:two-component system, NarL family, sensor kinase
MGTEERKIFIAFVIVSTFIGLVILFFFVNLLKQQRRYRQLQKEKLNSEINAAEMERNLIATELHNDIGPYLSSVKMRLDVIETAQSEELDACKAALDKCVQQVRDMAKAMAPLSIFEIPFQDALKMYIQEVNVHGTLKVVLTELDIVPLIPDQNNQIYRILQEIIQNTIKHAQASSLHIEISREGHNTMLIRTSDNGVGYELEKVRAANKLGMGLLGIQSRIDYLNGSISSSAENKSGTRYNIRIPILS